eukprot:GCRY01001159.1.p1 GENE.GCRY01001159.1~~GCRY01001159.1.p1  ORF type:complete len:293 (+),score=12.83 GCRY01001159.1:122-1000(+)
MHRAGTDPFSMMDHMFSQMNHSLFADDSFFNSMSMLRGPLFDDSFSDPFRVGRHHSRGPCQMGRHGFPHFASPQLPHPGHHCHVSSFSQSYSSCNGQEPVIHCSSTSTRVGPEGTHHTTHTVQDSQSGLSRMTIERGLADGRCRRTTRERNELTGNECQTDDFIHVDHNKCEDFDREWEERACREKLFNTRSIEAAAYSGRGSQAEPVPLLEHNPCRSGPSFPSHRSFPQHSHHHNRHHSSTHDFFHPHCHHHETRNTSGSPIPSGTHLSSSPSTPLQSSKVIVEEPDSDAE